MLALVALAVSGCGFIGLHEDVAALNALATISGTVDGGTRPDKPVFVALYARDDSGGYVLHARSLRYGPGEFRFLAREGSYYLIAFEDVNEDFIAQSGEHFAWYGAPTPIEARSGVAYAGLELTLREPEALHQVSLAHGAPHARVGAITMNDDRLGTIVNPDESRFSQSVGNLGMWEPIKFVRANYHGLFFLEPYDEDKIPILLIHGMGGALQSWRDLADRIDRERFQLWLVQYPSGLPLGLIRDELDEALIELQMRYRFDTLFVVGHSVGGLIARDLVNQRLCQPHPALIKLLVTISTPWQGHYAARLGVRRAPVVAPSWKDMVPDSPYLASMFARSWPEDTAHYLLFSYRGRRSLIDGGNSDGAATLESQLPLTAQTGAARVVGYNEDHVSILNSEQLAKDLNAILAQRATTVSCAPDC